MRVYKQIRALKIEFKNDQVNVVFLDSFKKKVKCWLFIIDIIWYMSIECLIFTILTVYIPAKLTYRAFKDGHKEESIKLWSHYWGFFFFFKILTCYITFLNWYLKSYLVNLSSSPFFSSTFGFTYKITKEHFSYQNYWNKNL